ncbi:sodium-dependent transporter [Porticoccus sp. GXU_MW_L64]
MGTDRGQFSSRFGFIMAAAGSAVGLGNVWGFPTNTAENGGGAFVLLYFVLAFVLAYPALMAELVIGRHTRANMVGALCQVAGKGPMSRVGKFTGLYAVLVASLILSFYSIVAGWMIAHLAEPIASALGSDSVARWLVESSTSRSLFFTLLFALATIWVISRGVEKGIEKWSSRLMPSLLLLLGALIVYVLLQEGAAEGLALYLKPDFSQITNPNIVVEAMGQAFFSLSLGVGTMLIYGSYISHRENLPKLGAIVTVVDTGIAFMAGLLIIPAMFVAQNNGVAIFNNGELVAGPGLIFQTLPSLFATMGAVGQFFAFAFFALMTIAALTSSISMLEVPVAYSVENHDQPRPKTAWLVGGVIFAISALIIFSGDAVFGFVVDLTTKYSQPMLGLLLCLFAGWVMHRNKLLEEIKQGLSDAEHSLFWKIWPGYVRYVCPLLIAVTFINSLL